MPFDGAKLAFASHRCQIALLVSTLSQALGLGHDCLRKSVGDSFLDIATLDGCTRLTGICERAPDRRARDIVEVRVLQYYHWIFATQLKHHLN